MTRAQAQIIDLIMSLPLSERRELIEHVQGTALLEESFYSRMTAGQRVALEESIAEADRGEGAPAGEVFRALFQKHGLESPV